MLSSRCISDYEVLQDQRQLPTALGWSLHYPCVSSAPFAKQVGSWTKRSRSGSRIPWGSWLMARNVVSLLTHAVSSSSWHVAGTWPLGRDCIRCQPPCRRAGPDQYTPSFLSDADASQPAALDRELFPWLQALYPLWARLTPDTLDLPSQSQWWSFCCPGARQPRITTTSSQPALRKPRRYRGRRGPAAGYSRGADARVNEPVSARRRIAAGQRRAGPGHHPCRQ